MDHPHDWDQTSIDQVEMLGQMLVHAVSRTRDRAVLAMATARARRIAEFLPDGLLLLSLRAAIDWASPSFARMVGRTAGSLVGRPLVDLVHPDDREALTTAIEVTLAGEPGTMTARVLGDGDLWRWADLSWRVVSEPGSGVPDEIVVSVRDTHDREMHCEQLVRRSERDSVTGLVNRAALDQTLDDLGQYAATVILAYCDVDKFKAINDRFGHADGDKVLRAGRGIALGRAPPRRVARVGGDEFIVLAKDVGANDDAVLLGERLVTSVRELSRQGGLPQITVSVGICGPAPASQVTELRLSADQAMYRAKRLGRDRCVQGDRLAFGG
jgi:diguanylate cyclase (GGDEF)-like protein/PAS domain S-box-containing protein